MKEFTNFVIEKLYLLMKEKINKKDKTNFFK